MNVETAKQLIAEAKEQKLTTLDLGKCGLTDLEQDVPELFEGMGHLEELYLSDKWWDYTAMKWINSRNEGKGNKLSFLPQSIANLKALKVLVAGFFLSGIARWDIDDIGILSQLTNLEILSLPGCQVQDIQALTDLKDLKILDLGDNLLSDVNALKELTNLHTLLLYSNKIQDLNFLGFLKNLRALYLWENEIQDIAMISQLSNLQELYISNNQIRHIDSLSKLTNLQKIYLHHNQIQNISSLSRLVNLQELELNDNQIQDISSLAQLSNLQLLLLDNNQIQDISSLAQLSNLKQLSLHNNQIKDLRPIQTLLKRNQNAFQLDLEHEYSGDSRISVKDNPLIIPPIGKIRRGKEAVLKYFEDIEKHGIFYVYEAKALIVGEPNAGKTTLRKNLLDPNYKVRKEDKETIGVEIYKGWKFPYTEDCQKTFVSNLWDFGGQDRQYPLHPYFMTEDTLYVLLSDDRADNQHLDKWFSMIRLLGGAHYKLIVVLNEINRSSGVSNFKKEKYEKQGFVFDIYTVDFSKDSEKKAILSQAIQKALCTLPHIGTALPGNCEKVRNQIIALKEKGKDYISYEAYEDVCEEVGMDDAEERKKVLDYLALIGDVVYYANDDSLFDLIILNPHWVIDAIYAVITYEKFDQYHSKGRFTKQELFEFWQNPVVEKQKKYKEGECNKLLPLLLKNHFDICFPLKGTNQYLVPLCMPEDLPTHTFEEKESLSLLFKYEIMPPGMVSRLVVRLSDDIEGELVSKNAIVLQKNEIRAKVEEYKLPNDANKYIRLSVLGEPQRRKAYLLALRKALITVQQEWFKDLIYLELVPCNCVGCQKNEVPHFYAMNDIQNRLTKGNNTISCTTGYDSNIFELLGEIYKDFENGIKTLEDLIQYIENNHLPKAFVLNLIQILGGNNVLGTYLEQRAIQLHTFKEELLERLNEHQQNALADILPIIKNSIYDYKKDLYIDIENSMSPTAQILKTNELVSSTKILIHSITEK